MQTSIRVSPLRCAVLLALFQFIILLPLIGIATIGGSSEAREAHIARIIWEQGSWLLPLREGLMPSKPLLYHWITASIATLKGEMTPFVARLTSLVFGSGVIFLTALMVLIICEHTSERLRRDKYILATLAALILVTTYGFQTMVGDARVDMTCCFFVTLALFPVLTAVSRASVGGLSLAEIRKSWRWNLFFAASAFGVLAKGPIAVILPAIIVFCILLTAFGIRETGKLVFRPRIAWALFLLIALPWYILAAQHGGDEFLGRQLLFENLKRFTGGDAVNSEPPWYYLPWFLRSAAPWAVFFIFAIPELIAFLRSGRNRDAAFNSQYAMQYFFALWFWVGFIFMSLASGKRQSYLLPLYVGMAIFLALRSHQFFMERGDSLKQRLSKIGQSSRLFLIFLLLLVAVGFDVLRFPFSTTATLMGEVFNFLAGPALRIEALLTGLAAFLIITELKRTTALMRLFAVYAGVLGLVAVLVYSGLAVKYYTKGFDRVALQIESLVPAHEKIVIVREPRAEFFDALLFYLSRPVSLVSWQKANELCPAMLVIRRGDLKNLSNTAGLKLEEVQSFASLDRKYRAPSDPEYSLIRCS